MMKVEVLSINLISSVRYGPASVAMLPLPAAHLSPRLRTEKIVMEFSLHKRCR